VALVIGLTGIGVAVIVTTGSHQAVAQAGPIYVDAGGHGATCNDGRGAAEAQSASTPVCTIPRGIALAGAAGSVTVRGGSYPALAIAGGNRTNWVTVAAAAGETVSIPGISLTQNASWLRFQGLTVNGGSGSALRIAEGRSAHIALVNSDVRNTGGADVVALGAGTNDVLLEGDAFTGGGEGVSWVADGTTAKITNVTVRNSHFKNIGTDALRPANFDTVLIEGNEIEGLAENGDHSDALQSYAGGAHLVFRGNYVHHNASEGFFIKDGHVDDVAVVNNIFAHNTGAASPLKMYDTTGVQIINNTLWDNQANPVLSSGLSNVTIRNNIIERLDADATVANVTQDHNVLGGTYGWQVAATDVRGRPTFVNAAAGDYRLAARSVGIDVGSSIGATTTDKACRPRYDDPATANRGAGDKPFVDAGALEFGPATAATDTAVGAGCVVTTQAGAPPAAAPPPAPTVPAAQSPAAATCPCTKGTISGGGDGTAASATAAEAAASASAACQKAKSKSQRSPLSVRSAHVLRGRLMVTVRAVGACRVSIGGTATWTKRGKLRRSGMARNVRSIKPNAARRIRFRLPRSARSALSAHKRVVLHLTFRVTTADGTKAYRRVVRLRR
jgi:hypothetical protein